MPVTVYMYSFSKRENSTATPTGGDSYLCLFKDDISILNPIILLKVPANKTMSTMISYNYCRIQTFGRYYFVRDAVIVNNECIEFHLEVDVMASWKSNIGSASEYVLRAASDYDEDVIDNLYPVNANVSYDSSGDFNPLSGYSSTTVLGVINNKANSKRGAVTYYAVSDATMGSLMGFMLGSTSYMNIQPSEASPEYIKATVNPSQYVVDCFTIPYSVTSSTTEKIAFGWWDSPYDGNVISSGGVGWMIMGADASITLPKHPLFTTRGRGYRCYPYTRYTLYAGPFGEIPIDPALVTRSVSLSFNIWGNIFGDIVLHLKAGDGTLIGKYRANCRIQYLMGQVNNDPSAFWSGVANTASAMSSAISNPVGAIAGVTSGILSNAQNLYPQVRTFGSNVTGLESSTVWKLVAEFHEPVDFDDTHRGRPLCQVKTISSLSGYILVSDPDIAIPGTAEENEKIKNYMASGFYYE